MDEIYAEAEALMERVVALAEAAPRGIIAVDPVAGIGAAMVGPNCIMLAFQLQGIVPIYDVVLN